MNTSRWLQLAFITFVLSVVWLLLALADSPAASAVGFVTLCCLFATAGIQLGLLKTAPPQRRRRRRLIRTVTVEGVKYGAHHGETEPCAGCTYGVEGSAVGETDELLAARMCDCPRCRYLIAEEARRAGRQSGTAR